jgi:hypothetical protein
MAEFWENDPVDEQQEPAKKTSKNFWEDDPVVKEGPSTLGSAARGLARAVIPGLAGVAGAIGGGAGGAALGTAALPGAGTVAGGIGGAIIGGGAASSAARGIQDRIADTLGLDSPESREADVEAHPNVTLGAELAGSAIGLSPGSATTKLAQRLSSGAIMGGWDALQQGITKGEVDPTEALASGALGFALPNANKRLVGGVAAAAEQTLGPRAGAAVREMHPLQGQPDEAAPPEAGEPQRPDMPPGARAAVEAGQEQAKQAKPGQTVSQEAPRRQTPVQDLPYAEDAEPLEGAYNEITPRADAGPGVQVKPAGGNAGRPNFLHDDPAAAAAEKFAATDQASPLGANVSPTVGTAGTPAGPVGGQRGGVWYGKGPNPQALPEGAAPDGGGVQRVENIGQGADVMAAMAQKPPLPGPDVKQGPAEQQKQLMPQPFSIKPEEGPPPFGQAAKNTPSRPPLNKGGEFNARYPGQNIKIPEKLQAWRAQNPEEYPALPGVKPAEPPGAVAAKEAGARAAPANLLPGENLHLPPFLQRVPGQEQKPFGQRNLPAREQVQGAGKPVGEASEAENAKVAEMLPVAGEQKPTSAGAAALNPGQKAGLISRFRDWAKSIKDDESLAQNPLRGIFSPQSVSEPAQQTANIFREQTGLQSRVDVRAARNISDKFQEAVNATPAEHVNDYWMNHDGGKVDKDNPLNALHPAVERARDYYNGKFDELNDAAQKQFHTNFEGYNHIWADPIAYNKFARGFYDEHNEPPTIREALDAGMQISPKVVRPDGGIDLPRALAMEFKQKSDFLSAQKTLEQMIERDKLAWTSAENGDIENMPGDAVKLNQTYKGLPVYAHPDVARVFNNAYSPGLHANPDVGKIFDIVQHGKNAMTAMQLLGGGFHMVFVTLDSINSAMATGFHQIFSGDIAGGLKTMAKAPAAPYTFLKEATKGLGEYGEPGSMDARTQRIVTLLSRANAGFKRLASETPEYNISGNPAGDFFNSFKRGRLQLETEEYRKGLKEAFDQSAFKGVNKSAATAFDITGRVMQTMMKPLFDVYIPRLKVGAMMHEMGAFLDARGDNLTDEQAMQAARRISDSIDNRLGEMQQRNIFWNKVLKQGAQVSFLSWSFNMGDVRELGGGALKMLRNPKGLSYHNNDFDPRLGYMLAFPMMTVVANSVYQYLKTGEMPKDPKDLFAPRTGGKAARSNEPERSVIPGYEKDVLGYYANPLHEIYNKLSAPVHLANETLTNKDWAGHPIWNPNDSMIQKMREYFGHVGQSMMPITAQTLQQTHEKSNISVPERLGGIRNAPAWVEKPVQIAIGEKKRNQREWEAKKRFEKRTGY